MLKAPSILFTVSKFYYSKLFDYVLFFFIIIIYFAATEMPSCLSFKNEKGSTVSST